MAKGSKTRYTTTSSSRLVRDPIVIASPRLHQPSLPMPLFLLEDRRTFHPDGPLRFPASVPRSATQPVVKGRQSVGSGKRFKASKAIRLFEAVPQYVGFRRPDRVAICVRRKTRREVVFARGFGGAGNRKGKRTYKSKFHCG